MQPRIGVLALQGDFAAHAEALRGVGAEPAEVRLPADLEGCRGLVLPGGESTTLLHLLEPAGLFEGIREFHGRGGALFGTCAGAILLARKVVPEQRSLGLIDAVVERNAYGRQRESFEGLAEPAPGFPVASPPGDDGLPMLFIRAPRIRETGPGVQDLATWGEDVVLARQGRVLISTGHPELGGSLRVHRLFLEIVRKSASERRIRPIPLPGAA